MNLKLITILFCVGIFNIHYATAQEIQYKSSEEEFLVQLADMWKTSEITLQTEEKEYKKKKKYHLVVSIVSGQEFSEDVFSDLVSSSTQLIFDGIANIGTFKSTRIDFKNTKTNEEKSNVLYKLIDSPPVLKGCSKSLTSKQQKRCFSEKVSKHLSENFDPSKFSDIGLESKTYEVNAIFVVNEKGKISDIRIDHENEVIQQTITELVQSIKVRKPGYDEGKPVRVSYTLPIVFKVK